MRPLLESTLLAFSLHSLNVRKQRESVQHYRPSYNLLSNPPTTLPLSHSPSLPSHSCPPNAPSSASQIDLT